MSTPVQELYALLSLVPDEKTFKQGDKLLDGIATAAKSMAAAVAGAFAVDAIYDFVRGTLSAVPEIDDLAQRVGFAAEEIQRLGYAASVSGTDAETLNASLGFLVKNLGEARTGNEAAAKSFASLGVNIDKARTPRQVFDDVADAVAGMTDPTQRAATTMALFGRSGAKLTQLLGQGSSAIRGLGAEVEVLSTQEIRAIGEVDDKLVGASYRIDLAGKRIVSALLPVIEVFVDIAEAISKMPGKVKDLTRALRNLGTIAGIVLVGHLARLGFAFIATQAAAIATAVATGQVLPGAFFAAVTAIDLASISLFGFIKRAAVLAAPVLAGAAALAVLYLIVDDVWTSLNGGRGILTDLSGKWGELTESFYRAWEGGTGVTAALAGVASVLSFVLFLFDNGVDQVFRFFNYLGEVWDNPRIAIEDFAQALLTVESTILRVLSSAAKLIGLDTIGGVLAGGAEAFDSKGTRDIASRAALGAPILGSPALTSTREAVNVAGAQVQTVVNIAGNATREVANSIGRSVEDGVDAANRRMQFDLAGGV